MQIVKEKNSIPYILCEVAAFAGACIFSCVSLNLAAAVLLMVSGIGIFFSLAVKTGNFLNSRGLFLAAWNCTIGLSCLKIHPSQVQWEIGTWICFLSAALFFLVGYDYGIRTKKTKIKISIPNKLDRYLIFLIMSLIIIAVFLLEVVVCGGVPILSSNMSSYANFGLPYLHYITVTSAIVPAIGIALFNGKNADQWTKIRVFALSAICAMIPFALVSRQLILQMVIVFIISFCRIYGIRKIRLRYVLIAGVLVIAVWVFATGKRNQSDTYIQTVFNLGKTANAKLYQVYLYIAYNYDVFNDNLRVAAYKTLGFKSLNPLWTLLGLKRFWPASVTNFEQVKSIAVFTTAPFIFTPYNDFGYVGIVVFCFLLGLYVHKVESISDSGNDSIFIVKKSVVDYCLIMSFFTCFFSNTMIWVQLIVLSLFSFTSNTVRVTKKQEPEQLPAGLPSEE